ncbi:heme oxygenase-like protein, partial [Tilletiaria anomala UBC 951]
ITEHLLLQHTASFKRATQHAFLRAAGSGELPALALEAWLRQDRLYASIGYVRLLGLMLARMPVSDEAPGTAKSQRAARVRKLLAAALSNIDREINFFEQTAADFGLSLKAENTDELLGPYAPVTKAYIDWIVHIATTGSFEEQLILLWAMEELYLTAWTCALSQAPWSSIVDPSARPNTALRHFIENWTSREFVAFVQEIRELTDEFCTDAQGARLASYEEVWRQTLWYEERFW